MRHKQARFLQVGEIPHLARAVKENYSAHNTVSHYLEVIRHFKTGFYSVC